MRVSDVMPAALLAVGLIVPSIGAAGTLWLNNGDQLAGELEKIEGGSLHWKSETLGSLTLPLDKVRGFESAAPMALATQDAGPQRDCLFRYVDGRQFVDCGNGQYTRSLPSFSRFTADVVPTDQEIGGYKVTGFVDVAVQTSSGNTEKESYNATAEVQLRSLDLRHTFSGEYQKEQLEGEEAENRTDLNYKLDRFLTEKWYLTGNLGYLTDDERDIEERYTIGAGIGYQFVETSTLNFSVETGLTYISEDRLTRDLDDAAWRTASDFGWVVTSSGIKLFNKNEVLSLLSEDGYEVKTATGLILPINGHLNSLIQYEWDYDSEPEELRESVDRRWSLGLRYKW